MKFQSWYDYFVVFIVIVKISFFILSFSLIYLKIKTHGQPETEIMKNLTYWKERVEFVFILDIAILLTYLFYPKREKPIPIDNISRNLLFAYGILIMLTAKWDLFFKEDKWVFYFQRVLGGNYYKEYTADEFRTIQMQVEIDKNIRKSEGMRNLQDYPNVRNFCKNNAEYQKYYTRIYPPDTIGQIRYNPVSVANVASNFSNRFPPKSSL
jgi:hypothetical protein